MPHIFANEPELAYDDLAQMPLSWAQILNSGKIKTHRPTEDVQNQR